MQASPMQDVSFFEHSMDQESPADIPQEIPADENLQQSS
jgi:hypothetical protein